MNALSSIRTRFPAWGTIVLSDAPAVIFPDTINLLHERLASDVWGEAGGRRVCIETGCDATRGVLDSTFESAAVDRARRLALARMVFTACGEGRFGIDTDGQRRFAWGTALINSTAALREAGAVELDGDGFAAGFIAASVEAGLDRPPGSLIAREFRCVTRGDARCELEFVVRTHGESRVPLTHQLSVEGLDSTRQGDGEAEIADLARQVAAYLDAQPVDADGCVTIFGVRVSLRPAAWYGLLSARASDAIAAEAGLAIERLHELQRAIARRWVEDLLLPALASDEFELFAGGIPSTGRDAVVQACALARASGMGRWGIAAWQSGRELRLSTPWTPEAACLRASPQRSTSGTAFIEGAASALLALGTAIDQGLDPLDVVAARAAMRSGQRRAHHVTHTSIATGGSSCEVAATQA
jgi:hypothetical protein